LGSAWSPLGRPGAPTSCFIVVEKPWILSAQVWVECVHFTCKLQNLASYSRPVYTIVPKSALNASASTRLEDLAQPKIHHLLPIMDLKRWDWSDWEGRVSSAAKKAVSSAHVENLAQAKMPHALYQGQRTVQWDVQDTAKKASASFRVVQLARPRSRGTINDDYDPYKVSLAAKHAVATPRLGELCAPIPRKIRQKKTGAA
jgi:hypothetical protein